MSVLQDLLAHAVQLGASDVLLRVGSEPGIRVDGEIVRLGDHRLTHLDTEAFAQEMMTRPGLWTEFLECRETDFAHGVPGLARFRVNAYFQRGTVALVLRVIEERPLPGFAELGLPPQTFMSFAGLNRGLILITGPTGSGKTTTLAALIGEINRTRAVNVVTLEDPIEVLHKDLRAMISQRELGTDTRSFATGLRSALRQSPDVILIGEMRDKETVEAALSAAQTGHLVLSTLHTQDALRTVNRVIDFFAPQERDQIRLALSESLVAVVSQRLLPGVTGGQVLGMELLLNTPTVRDCLREAGRMDELKGALLGGGSGMHTFDQHLARLVLQGALSLDAALQAATVPHEVKIMLIGAEG